MENLALTESTYYILLSLYHPQQSISGDDIL